MIDLNLEEKNLMAKITSLKKEKSVYIIAHYYQRSAIQDIADFVGDSYAMAVAAKHSPLQTILVAGVDFMAESAAILCPDKTILSPEPMATCPMANSISVEDVEAFKKEHREGLVISYVNTSAAIKAVSDICCTSSNAGTILQKMPPEARIFFIPDQNLAANVGKSLGRSLDTFDSCCPIHAKITKEIILSRKKEHPDAPVLVHPECDPEVVALADYVGSTAGMIAYAKENDAKTLIVGTETGILHTMQKNNPEKSLIIASEDLICPNMKSITLEKILHSLQNRETVITVPENIRAKAAVALEKMIEYTAAAAVK